MVDLPASYVIRPEDTLFIHLLECPQYSCKSILIPPKNINIIEHITYLRVFWSAGWENGYPDFIVLKIDHRFVGGFSPTHLKKIFATSIWIISPNSDENKKYLKPHIVNFANSNLQIFGLVVHHRLGCRRRWRDRSRDVGLYPKRSRERLGEICTGISWCLIHRFNWSFTYL